MKKLAGWDSSSDEHGVIDHHLLRLHIQYAVVRDIDLNELGKNDNDSYIKKISMNLSLYRNFFRNNIFVVNRGAGMDWYRPQYIARYAYVDKDASNGMSDAEVYVDYIKGLEYPKHLRKLNIFGHHFERFIQYKWNKK